MQVKYVHLQPKEGQYITNRKIKKNVREKSQEKVVNQLQVQWIFIYWMQICLVTFCTSPNVQ